MMLNDQKLKEKLLSEKSPILRESFYQDAYEVIEKELTVKKSYNGGEVLVLKDYLFKPYIWVLCMLIVWASVALFYVRVGHVDDDLTKLDALSISTSLTL